MAHLRTIGLVFLGLAAASPALADEPTRLPDGVSPDVKLDIRRPLAFILFTPAAEVGTTRSAEIVRAVDELCHKQTDFRLERRDQEEARECKGKLGCITEVVRGGKPNPAQYLLIVSKVAEEDLDRISVTLVDTDAAMEALKGFDRSQPNWSTDAEAKVAQVALVAPPRSVEAKNEDEALRFIDELFRTEFRRRFEDSGHWDPFGVVEIKMDLAGVGLKFDGSLVTTTKPGLTRLVAVPPGKHTLTFEHADYKPEERQIEVKRRETAQLSLTLQASSSSFNSTMRTVTLWGGVAVAALGVGTTVWAVSKQDGSIRTYCPTLDGNGGCDGSRFISLNYDSDKAPSFGNDVNPNGLLLAPLGYSMILGGAAWSLGTFLIGDDDDPPWIQLGAGVVLGLASYLISAAVNPKSPFEGN